LDSDFIKNDQNPEYGVKFMASSSDSNYNDLSNRLNLTHGDNDYTPILALSDLTGDYTDEFGLEQTFTVNLTIQPSADIYFSINSSDSAEGIASSEGVYFISDTSNLTALSNSQYEGVCQTGEYLDCSGGCVTGASSTWTCTDTVTASGISFVSWDTK